MPSKHSEQERVTVASLRMDGGTQPRVELNQLVIDDYVEKMKTGERFPPVVVYYDGTDYWLADGFHRLLAAKASGVARINADVRMGTQRDAILWSVGANATHGLPRTNADKRRAALTLLRDDEWKKWSDRIIAKRCAVTRQFVCKLRSEASSNGCKMPGARQATRGGKTYTVDTTKIGATQKIPKRVRQAIMSTDVADDPGQLRELAKLEAEQQQALAAKIKSGEASTVREARRLVNEDEREQIRKHPVRLPKGKYRCIVMDPPWVMEKSEREDRPNQIGLGYPTMTEEELLAFPVPSLVAESGCHLYLWTTHKHLPAALRLVEAWGFEYHCLLTWVKNVGFTPFSFMFSTEHVVFARRGNLDLLVKGRRLDFAAKVREHSRKPDEFYELARDASPGPRIDLFSREPRKGFDQHGNQVDHYAD